MARVYTAICAALNINGVTDKSVLGYPLWLVVTVGLLALCVVVVLVAIIANELSKGLSRKKDEEEEEESSGEDVASDAAQDENLVAQVVDAGSDEVDKGDERIDNSTGKSAGMAAIADVNAKAIKEDNSLFNAELAKVDNKADDNKPSDSEQQDNKKQDEKAQEASYARRAKHAAASRKRKEIKVALDGYLPHIKD